MLDVLWKGVPPLSDAQRSQRLNVFVAVLMCLVLSGYYFFQLTAGTGGPLVVSTNYYDLMCEGFRQGHLYVPIAPKPELLAKPDPFAWDNLPLWLWDATLYRKHYYVYWGPVPGLLLLVYKVLTGTTSEVIDQWIGFPFVLGRLYAASWLIVAFANGARTRQRPWVVALAIAVFALASPTPFTVARMHVYEASLMAGQCFLLFGLVCAYCAIAHERRRMAWLVAAGACFGLAMSSRVATGLAIPGMILATVVVLWYKNAKSFRLAFRSALALGIPSAAFLIGLLWYNYVRFDSFFEFGITHQVTRQKFTFNWIYVIPNLFAYSFAGLDWSCRFPFAVAPTYRELTSLIHWPSSYLTFERAVGMFSTAVITWLSALLFWRFGAYLWSKARGRGYESIPRLSAMEAWLLLCNLASVFAILPALGLWEASARYLGDAITGFVLASLLAAFWVLRRVDYVGTRKARLFAHLGFAALALHTCFVGAFSGIATYADAWQKTNPELYHQLEDKLSLCEKPGAH